MKARQFIWGQDHEDSFQKLKSLLSLAPILALPNFEMSFQVEADAFAIRIGVLLTQEGKLIEYFSEKLSLAR